MSFSRLNRSVTILNVAALLALVVSIAMIFFYAPVERTMGNVQRIFYFHVGTAWVGAVAFFVALVAAILYLRKPDRKWDTIALSSVEVGLVFLTITTAAGQNPSAVNPMMQRAGSRVSVTATPSHLMSLAVRNSCMKKVSQLVALSIDAKKVVRSPRSSIAAAISACWK